MSIKQKLMNALKFIGAAAAFAIIVPFVGAKASAATYTTIPGLGFDINTSELKRGTDYDYTHTGPRVLTIMSDKQIMIRNTDKNTPTESRIEVADGVNANIILDGVNIENPFNFPAFKIADNSTGNVTITLADGSVNTLKSGMFYAGLQKNGSGENIGTLTIQGGTEGTGSLEATGGHGGAGIGGYDGNGSNITITGGKIIAQGGDHGAGIGGGEKGSGSNIKISGGTVTATGGTGGAGIGGGEKGSGISNGSNITISGGIVNATGIKGGAGIGGGGNGNGSNIKISGGIVTATGAEISQGHGGAGIGGGLSGSGSNIIIDGGSVKATAGSGANAIGGGKGYSPVTPKNIDNKDVYLLELAKATKTLTIDGNEYPTDHGDGKVYAYLSEGDVHTVLTDGKEKKYVYYGGNFIEVGTALTVTATNGGTLVYGTDYTYPVETGVLTIKSDKAITIANADPTTPTTDTIVVEKNISAKITLNGVNINASGGSAFKIEDNSTGNVTITLADNSKNVLKSGNNCAGLEKNGSYTGTLTIQGGNLGTGSLEATGGDNGAGIGGGYNQSSSNITISGGTVIATGGSNGAGIGGGLNANGYNITISGGTVIAKGGINGAGIGGGFADFTGSSYILGDGENIKIIGGTVTATGGDYAAGIGGGNTGNGTNIIITGGSVKATAGFGANAIGDGSGGNAVTPKNGSADVYLCEIENPNGEKITIDGKDYPSSHGTEQKIYAYLTGTDHAVTVGNTKYNCTFDDSTKKFTLKVVTTPSKPSGGNTRPTKPETPDYPEFNGKAMSWEDIAGEIAKLDEGSEITLVIYDHTEVPADVINAISDRKIKATLKVGGRKDWFVDGAKISEKVLKNVDFSLGSADVSGKEKLRGIVGFEFSFDGAEFTSELSLMFKEEHAGKFANLFRKDGEKLVFINNAKIDSDGSVSGLTVREKGKYVVMICEFSDRAGDVDNDGILTAKDALAALKHFAKVENGANPVVADMNNDGVVNANDALIILKKYAGIAG